MPRESLLTRTSSHPANSPASLPAPRVKLNASIAALQKQLSALSPASDKRSLSDARRPRLRLLRRKTTGSVTSNAKPQWIEADEVSAESKVLRADISHVDMERCDIDAAIDRQHTRIEAVMKVLPAVERRVATSRARCAAIRELEAILSELREGLDHHAGRDLDVHGQAEVLADLKAVLQRQRDATRVLKRHEAQYTKVIECEDHLNAAICSADGIMDVLDSIKLKGEEQREVDQREMRPGASARLITKKEFLERTREAEGYRLTWSKAWLEVSTHVAQIRGRLEILLIGADGQSSAAGASANLGSHLPWSDGSSPSAAGSSSSVQSPASITWGAAPQVIRREGAASSVIHHHHLHSHQRGASSLSRTASLSGGGHHRAQSTGGLRRSRRDRTPSHGGILEKAASIHAFFPTPSTMPSTPALPTRGPVEKATPQHNQVTQQRWESNVSSTSFNSVSTFQTATTSLTVPTPKGHARKNGREEHAGASSSPGDSSESVPSQKTSPSEVAVSDSSPSAVAEPPSLKATLQHLLALLHSPPPSRSVLSPLAQHALQPPRSLPAIYTLPPTFLQSYAQSAFALCGVLRRFREALDGLISRMEDEGEGLAQRLVERMEETDLERGRYWGWEGAQEEKRSARRRGRGRRGLAAGEGEEYQDVGAMGRRRG